MAKVIICIHGLGNKPANELLTKWWELSIREGLRNIGQYFLKPKIEMVYWSDVLHNKPLDEKITDTKDPYFLIEKYTPAPKNFVPQKHEVRKKFLDFIEKQIDKLFLNKDMSVNYSFISDYIIHRYFKDLETYYNSEYKNDEEKSHCAREVIRKRLADVLDKHENNEIFLISHSMGTIVAYDVLVLQLTKTKIDTFVTMGSPLGIPVVMGKIAAEYGTIFQKPHKLTTPQLVTKFWYNFSDIEDKVAMNYNLADDYDANEAGIKPIDFIVNNNYTINGELNPHKSYGYLRTPEFSRVLLDFLTRDRLKITVWYIKVLNKIYGKTIHATVKSVWLFPSQIAQC